MRNSACPSCSLIPHDGFIVSARGGVLPSQHANAIVDLDIRMQPGERLLGRILRTGSRLEADDVVVRQEADDLRARGGDPIVSHGQVVAQNR